MSNIYFDIRGGALKVLIIDGKAVRYKKIFESFSIEDKVKTQKIFRQISDESGVKPEIVHLVLPVSEVKIKAYKLQKMTPDDARMIIRRKMIVEEGIEDPVFHLMPRDPVDRQQEFVAALVDPEGLKKYVMLLSGFGIKIKTITTSFHSNLRAFDSVKGSMPQTAAIFEVGADSVEIMVISPSRIIAYEVFPVSIGEAEGTVEERDIEIIRKKRLYGIIDALYKFMISYRENYSDTPIEKVLLCGRVDMDKISGAVEEAVGSEASLWNLFGEDVINGAEFTALYGFSLSVSDGTTANLISKELLRRKQLRLSRSAMAVLFCIYIAVVLSIYFVVESRYKSSLKLLDAELMEKKALSLVSQGAGKSPDLRESLLKLAEKQPQLYDIFRYLGNNLPQEVLLDEIVFKHEGEDEVMQLSLVSKYNAEIGRKRYFTSVVESISGSGRLSLMKEPSFSVSSDLKDPLIHIQLICRIIPYDKIQ